MLKIIYRALVLVALTGTITSCYKMPTENDFSLIPTTNNQDYARVKKNDKKSP